MHQVSCSAQQQASHLCRAGYLDNTLVSTTGSLIKEVKTDLAAARCNNARASGRPVAVPSVHGVSHHLNNVANQCSVGVFFSATRARKNVQVGKQRRESGYMH